MCDSTKIKPGGHISIDKYRPLVAIKKIAGLRLNFEDPEAKSIFYSVCGLSFVFPLNTASATSWIVSLTSRSKAVPFSCVGEWRWIKLQVHVNFPNVRIQT